MQNELSRPSISSFRNKSYSTAVTSRSSTSSSASYYNIGEWGYLTDMECLCDRGIDEAGSSDEEDEETRQR
ncbi:hypothetical protein GQ600_11263 [Phytophthora cactorum]|nr:hypothetical protein GQ600_11263 [Phytophthora cactorum]